VTRASGCSGAHYKGLWLWVLAFAGTTRHCERSEAIHLAACGSMDCFALLAMTGLGLI
jgi:hypothetical protein